jgi:Ran GTPase-activating protein (RanGAP) involved in mRNA processing and transport
MICQCQSENRSLIDLRNKQLIDRDMKIIVKEVLFNKQCTRLWLDGNRLTSIGASVLSSALNNNNTLERLYLYGNSISDIGLKYLCKTLSMHNKTLKILGLQQNQITDLGAEHLSQMLKLNKSLTALWLDQNDISDKGVKFLSNALQYSNSSLQYIDLSRSRLITDVSVGYIEDIIKFNKTITEISLYDCNLSRTAKDKLKIAIKSRKTVSIYLNSWNE